jgi:3-hydroxyacyl-CoA dehydrogenase
MDSRSVAGKAVVVGAGVMGAQIAAHLANAGWRGTLLDVAPADAQDAKSRNAFAQKGLERAQKTKPAAFFVPDLVSRVRLGNTSNDFALIREADWVLEAVVEKPEIKRQVHAAIEEHLGPDTLVTTNTSGLSISEMSEGRSDSFRSRFFGTHFFNPPRYMKLLEVIPTPATSPEAITRFNAFAEAVLGKRIVAAKDTPGFIANRLGVYAMQVVLHAALEHGLTVEQVDALTGPLIGHPKSATFRLSDICGLDISADVANNLTQRLPDDRYRAAFALPAPMQRLLADGRIGEKVGAGFYKRLPDKTILALDWQSMDYRPRQSAVFPSIEGIKALPLPERLRALLNLKDAAGEFLWQTTRDILCYAAEVGPNIADDIVAIDNACKWGFNWELGPFETWDALGIRETAERVAGDGLPIPHLVQTLLDSGRTSFYRSEGAQTFYVDLRTPSDEHPTPSRPEFIVLKDVKKAGGVIKETPDATLIDLGDGVNCLEFHTKMNVLGPGISQMIEWSREETERNGAALVIGNQGEHFSAGFNIQLILMSVYEQDWDEMALMGRQLQEILLRLKRARIPAVAATHGYTLGGGCEVMLHCAAVQASAESYIGLPEAGIGVIPGAGGTTEMLVRAMAEVPPDVDPFPFVREAFMTLGMAKVSTSAEEARRLGFLRPSDGITMNPDRVLYEAKQRALALAAASYRPPQPAQVMAMGQDGIARFDLELHIMRRSGWISEHDQLIGHELARVMCGGELAHPQLVSEEYLLGLEREAFARLCATPKTGERLRAMLETGKPLRN